VLETVEFFPIIMQQDNRTMDGGQLVIFSFPLANWPGHPLMDGARRLPGIAL
jgi:hypothetical protein